MAVENRSAWRHAWCGHIVRYKPTPTEAAIQQVLAEKDVAIVIPVLVAVDETFQGRIIGGAVANVAAGERVRYRRDSILPDDNVKQWILDVCHNVATNAERMQIADN